MTSQNRPLIGMLWMVLTGLNFVAVTAIVKHVGSEVPAAQGAFLRYLLGLVFLIPMIRPILAAHLTRRQLKLFAARGVVHTVAVICWFFAMSRIPIADVTAMNYMSPVYITLGAALLLGERLPPRRLAAVVCALIGALIILRPGFREIDAGHIAMLFTAFGFAAGYLIAKQMAGEVSAAVIVGMLSITVTIGPRALCGRGLGASEPHGCGVAVSRGLFCHGGALHDDLGFCRGALNRHTAGDVFAACLGRDFGRCGVWRASRWLGRFGRRGDLGVGEFHYLARGAGPRGSDARGASNERLKASRLLPHLAQYRVHEPATRIS